MRSPSSSLSSAEKPSPRLILASGSPQRRALLEQAGHSFEVRPADVAELTGGLPGDRLAIANAELKARAVASGLPAGEDLVVLGADTVVEVGDQIHGQPEDRQRAEAMLRTLSGSRHSVHTGVCVIIGSQVVSSVDTAIVRFRQLSEQDISSYLDTGEWRGRAGGYAIQETGDRFAESIEGSFDTVIGLPMKLVESLLAAAVQAD